MSTQYQISTVSSVYTETEWFAATATVTITHTETEISTLPAQTIKETLYCEFKILLSMINELIAETFADQGHAISNLAWNYHHKHWIPDFYFNSTRTDSWVSIFLRNSYSRTEPYGITDTVTSSAIETTTEIKTVIETTSVIQISTQFATVVQTEVQTATVTQNQVITQTVVLTVPAMTKTETCKLALVITRK